MAIDLMQDAANDMDAVLRLSPTLREIVARVDENMKKPGADPMTRGAA